MFSENARGERCWQWEGKRYSAPFPQKEVASGEGWSLHLRRKGETWTNYCLYTKRTGGRGAWHLSIGRGMFAKTADFDLMRGKRDPVLKWLMDFHRGNLGAFPAGFFVDEKPVKEIVVRAPRKKKERNPFPEDKRRMMANMVKAQNDGVPIFFSQTGNGIFATLGAKTMAEKNVARDFLDEMTLVGAIVITPNGYKVVESDLEKISDRLLKFGYGTRRQEYGRRRNKS